jgi:hypothetical protein
MNKFWISCALACAAAATQAAIVDGNTPQGRAFTQGGASIEELNALHNRRDAFSLWVITAAKRSGAYLADVQLRITDAERRTVFDGRLEGPWLFVDLALGRYTIEARFNGEVQQRVTTIHPGDHHQAFFYFDVPDEVSPDPQQAFTRNPYGK